MKLLNIMHSPIYLEKTPMKGYWVNKAPVSIFIQTDEGTHHATLDPGWITDERSGCSLVDIIIPKWDGPYSDYSALIAFHDFCWSGWVKRNLADEILRQGCIYTQKSGKREAALVKWATDHFGHYYELNEPLDGVYTQNREFEHYEFIPDQTR